MHLLLSLANMKLLFDAPNIDVNIVNDYGRNILYLALNADEKDIEMFKLMLNVPNIDVNIVHTNGTNILHEAVFETDTIEMLRLLINHPRLTTFTLNLESLGVTPVMRAVIYQNMEALALLVADLRVDLDTIDNEMKNLADNEMESVEEEVKR